MEVNRREHRSLRRRAGWLIFKDEVWQAIGSALGMAPRELEIIRQVFDDRSESRIARELGISPHTVHTYLERIYYKLNVASRVQLVVRVVEQQNALSMRKFANQAPAKAEAVAAQLLAMSPE